MPNNQIKYYRAGEVSVTDNGTVELAFASEQPYPRSFGNEVLSHQTGKYNFDFIASGSAPLLLEHNSRDQIGVIDAARVDPDNVSRATVRFSSSVRAQEIYQDIKDGIRKNVSVGYFVTKMEKRGDTAVCSWSPFEISIVSLPADSSVGIGRSAAEEDEIVEPINDETDADDEKINNEDDENPKAVSVTFKGKTNMTTENINAEIDTVIAFGRSFGYEDLAKDIALGGGNIDTLRAEILKIRAAVPTQNKGSVDLSSKEAASYSITRLLNGIMSGKRSGIEFEASDYLARSANEAGDFIPVNILSRASTTTVGGGKEWLQSNPNATLVKALLPATFLGAVSGVKTVSNLVGSLPIPTEIGLPTVAVTAEGDAVTYSDISTGSVILSPTKLSAGVDFTLEMLALANPSVDGYAEDALRRAAALKFESFVMGNILATSGIGSVDATAAFGYAEIVALYSKVKQANVTGDITSIVNAYTESLMQRTAVFAGTDSVRCADGMGKLANGGKYVLSNLAPRAAAKSTVLAGDFNYLTLADWGAPRVVVDPYSSKKTGKIEVQIDMLADAKVTQPGAFAKAINIAD